MADKTQIKPIVETFVVGELNTNCYCISCPKTGETLIIDPGDSAETITQHLLSQQLTPVAIVLTHGHFDHCLATLELKLAFDLPLWLHPADNTLLAQAASSAQHWLKHPVDPVPTADQALADHQLLSFGACQLTVLHTPGHTPGSVCLVGPELIFTGDTLFKDAIGGTNHRYSSATDLQASLNRIRQLPAEMVIYPGHGESAPLHIATRYIP